jgi:hypothetical protein
MKGTENMIKFGTATVLLLFLVGALGCGDSDGASRDSEAPHFTPAERASLNELFKDIKEASRRSFESGDWSIMAKLYAPGVLSCWDASGEDHRFSFLSTAAIPESARYAVGSLDDYVFGGVDTSNMGGTHFMSIRYETSYLSACEIPAAKRWPEHHLYLKKQGESFRLVHPCPLKEQIQQNAIRRVWPPVSGAQAAEIASAMTSEERRRIREQVRKDAFPLNAIHSIQDRYQLSYDQASLVLDRVCELSSQR